MKTGQQVLDRPPTPAPVARQPPARWRLIAQLAGPTVLLLVLLTAWLGFRGYTAWHELRVAQTQLAAVQRGLQSDADPAGLSRQLRRVGEHTAAARDATHDPVWRSAGDLPFVGHNFRTVTAIAEGSDSLARRALPALGDAAERLRAARSRPAAEGLPLATIESASTRLQSAVAGLRTASSTVGSSPATLLVGPVASARSDLLEAIGALQRRIGPISDATKLLPGALGATGPRTYFVAFVNPAEARGGGGLLGAYAIVRADRGRVTLETLGSNASLANLPSAPTGLDPDFEARYLPYGAATDWNVSNLSPHFPYTGQLWAAMYRSLTGTRVGGVLSLDPQALSGLLRGARPVSVAGRRVTAENVVGFLERDQYDLALSSGQRKQVLATVARAAAKRWLDEPGAVDSALLAGLSDAARAGHLRMMSADAAEQAVLARYPLAGVVPQTTRPFATAFVNNAGSGKLDTYLQTGLRYAVEECSARARTVTVSVVLRNDAPTSGLAPYVTTRADDSGVDGVPRPRPGDNRSWLGVMLTSGAQLRSATLDGRRITTTPGPEGSSAPFLELSTERGHPVVSTVVDVAPRTTATLVLRLQEPPSTASPLLLPQPTSRPQQLTSVGGGCTDR